MDAEDAYEEDRNGYPRCNGRRDAGDEGHPYPLSNVHSLVKGEAKVVFAKPVVESNGEAYYAGCVEKLHII
jgi:hypothetical protein